MSTIKKIGAFPDPEQPVFEETVDVADVPKLDYAKKRPDLFTEFDDPIAPRFQNSTEVLRSVEESGPEEFATLLREIALWPKEEKKRLIPREAVSTLMEKGFAYYEHGLPPFTEAVTLGSREHPFTSLLMLGSSPETEDVDDARATVGSAEEINASASLEEKTFWEVSKEEFVHLYHQFPSAGKAYWQTAWAGSDELEGDANRMIVRAVADTMWRDDVSHLVKNTEILNFAGFLREIAGDDGLSFAFEQELDFDNPKHFFRTGVLLEFLRKVHREISVQSEEGLNLSGTFFALERVVNEQKGSYLLNVRAKEILEYMKGSIGMTEREKRKEVLTDASERAVPFHAAPGVLAIDDRDGFFVQRGGGNEFTAASEEEEQMSSFALRPSWGGAKVNAARRAARLRESASSTMPRRLAAGSFTPLTLGDVAIARPDKTAEEQERDAENFHDFRYLLSRPVARHIREDLHIPLERLSLREQYHLLNFLKIQGVKEAGTMRDFADEYDVNGLRTFLALDYDERFGEKLIQLGRGLPHNLAEELFEKYSEIAALADGTETYLEKNFRDAGEKGAVIVRTVADRMLRKGKKLLEEFHQTLTALAFQHDVSQGNGILGRTFLEDADNHALGEYQKIEAEEFDKLKEKLAQVNGQALLLLSSLKALHDEEVPVNLDEIPDMEFGIEHPEGFSEEDKEAMRAVYRANYNAYPTLRDELLKGFEEILSGDRASSNLFYTIRHKDKDGKNLPHAFYRLEDKGDGRLYFGAFNVDPDYRGSALGEMMLEQSLDAVAKKGTIIEADCNQISSIAANYIERGFVGVKQHDPAGVGSLKIFRNDMLRGGVFSSVALPEEDIVAKVQPGTTTISGNLVIAAEPIENISKLPFHLLNETRDGKRYVLTRYFRTKDGEKKDKVAYAVFERVPTSTLKRFVTPKQKETQRDGADERLVS